MYMIYQFYQIFFKSAILITIYLYMIRLIESLYSCTHTSLTWNIYENKTNKIAFLLWCHKYSIKFFWQVRRFISADSRKPFKWVHLIHSDFREVLKIHKPQTHSDSNCSTLDRHYVWRSHDPCLIPTFVKKKKSSSFLFFFRVFFFLFSTFLYSRLF